LLDDWISDRKLWHSLYFMLNQLLSGSIQQCWTNCNYRKFDFLIPACPVIWECWDIAMRR